MTTKPLTASHSNQVRERRAQRSQQRLHKISSITRNPTSRPVPVVSRGGRTGTPVLQRTKTRSKRKFFIRLEHGAEMSLPAVPAFKPGWRLLSGLIVIALMVLIYVFTNLPEFQVTTLQIEGLERVNTADVESLLHLNGEPIYAVNIWQVKELLQKNYPELTDLSVSVNLPARVRIAAKERQPLIKWETKGKSYWIDTEGAIFPVRGEAETLLTIQATTLPPFYKPPQPIDATKTITSKSTPKAEPTTTPVLDPYKQRADLTIVLAAVELSKVVPKDAPLLYSPQDGLGWVDASGWKVYVGSNLEELDKKINQYQKISGELKKKGLKPGIINVSLLNAPFYRPEQ